MAEDVHRGVGERNFKELLDKVVLAKINVSIQGTFGIFRLKKILKKLQNLILTTSLDNIVLIADAEEN